VIFPGWGQYLSSHDRLTGRAFPDCKKTCSNYPERSCLLGICPANLAGVTPEKKADILKAVMLSTAWGMDYETDEHCGDITFPPLCDNQVSNC